MQIVFSGHILYSPRQEWLMTPGRCSSIRFGHPMGCLMPGRKVAEAVIVKWLNKYLLQHNKPLNFMIIIFHPFRRAFKSRHKLLTIEWYFSVYKYKHIIHMSLIHRLLSYHRNRGAGLAGSKTKHVTSKVSLTNGDNSLKLWFNESCRCKTAFLLHIFPIMAFQMHSMHAPLLSKKQEWRCIARETVT